MTDAELEAIKAELMSLPPEWRAIITIIIKEFMARKKLEKRVRALEAKP